MDPKGRDEFDRITAALSGQEDAVTLGKMMSAPGLKFSDKVFAFLAKDGMGFRLGPDFDPGDHANIAFEPLNPFKTKGPLKGWYVVSEDQWNAWEPLARSALAFTRTLPA